MNDKLLYRVKAVQTLILAGRHEGGKASLPQTARIEIAGAMLTLAAGSHPRPPPTDLRLPHRRCRPPVTSSGLNAQRRAARRRRTAEETGWMQIVEWYVELVLLTDSAGAGLNLAIAVGEADGPRLAWQRSTPPGPATAAAAYMHNRDGDPLTAARLNAVAARSAPSLPNATTARDRPQGSTRLRN